MNILFIILAFVISASVARLIIPRILLISLRKKLFDMPSERKVHKRAIPRLGGVSFFPTILFSSCGVFALRILMGYDVPALRAVYLLPECLFLVCGMTLLYLTGIADDLVGVRYRQKFVIQIICASFFPLAGLWINNFYGLFGLYALPAWIGMPFTVLLVVFVTNAINLIDGIDGLASGLSCIALGLLIIVCALVGQWTHAFLAAATLGVVITFYYYNVFSVSGRKLFMGDAGSLTLGYILSFLVLHFWQKTQLWDPFTMNLNMVTVSTLLIPLLDVVRVFYSRVSEGRNPFTPDKNHIHHRLLRTGMKVRTVMITLLMLSLFFVVSNFILSFYINTTFMLLLDLAFWLTTHFIIRYFIMKHETATGRKWYKTYRNFFW